MELLGRWKPQTFADAIREIDRTKISKATSQEVLSLLERVLREQGVDETSIRNILSWTP